MVETMAVSSTVSACGAGGAGRDREIAVKLPALKQEPEHAGEGACVGRRTAQKNYSDELSQWLCFAAFGRRIDPIRSVPAVS